MIQSDTWRLQINRANRNNKKKERLTASPTAPNPKTATVEPFVGFATFKAAPRPA